MTLPTEATVIRWAREHELETRHGSSGTSTYVMLERTDILSYWSYGVLQFHNTRDRGPGQPGVLDDFNAFKWLAARQAVMQRLMRFKALPGFDRALGQRDPEVALGVFADERELECFLNLYLLSILERLFRYVNQDATG